MKLAGRFGAFGRVVDHLLVKFAHVFTAIVALGTSAGLGILLELYGDHPKHGAFLLRAVHRLEALVVVPGSFVMLATGLWLVALSWSLDDRWIQAGIALWAIGLALVLAHRPILRRQIAEAEANGPGTRRYRSLSLVGRGVGAAAGFAVAAALYMMVKKPF